MYSIVEGLIPTDIGTLSSYVAFVTVVIMTVLYLWFMNGKGKGRKG